MAASYMVIVTFLNNLAFLSLALHFPIRDKQIAEKKKKICCLQGLSFTGDIGIRHH